jgi:tRNA nucleotidyltransferase/poly(A) polymerase
MTSEDLLERILEGTGVPPEALASLTAAVHAGGGRVLLVGGCIRDALLGLPVHDVDVEVRGIERLELEGILAARFRVDEVGARFAVYKATLPGGAVLDVALPRKERKSGTGHAGFEVEVDPYLSDRSAAARRDFTVNAIAYDMGTRELVDPFDGARDLKAGVLRAVSEAFGEDPLRVLRAAQFASRLEFAVDSATLEVCRALRPEMGSLPSEGVLGEYVKLLAGKKPSLGLDVLTATGWLAPGLAGLADDEAVPGGVAAAGRRLDAWAAIRPKDTPPQDDLLLGFTALTWDLPEDAAASALDTLVRLRHFSLDASRLRRAAQAALAGTDSALIAAAEEYGSARLPVLLAGAVGGFDPAAQLDRAHQIGVLDCRLPAFVDGADVTAAGLRPGPAVGRVLAGVRAAQLAGEIEDRQAALELAGRLAACEPPVVRVAGPVVGSSAGPRAAAHGLACG